jgi:hypothetical protein
MSISQNTLIMKFFRQSDGLYGHISTSIIWVTKSTPSFKSSRSKLTAQQIQQHIRTKRDTNGDKLFQTHEYATLNQIKYRCRKIDQKYGITAK